MASKIRLSDGRELMVGLSGKRTAEALEKSLSEGRPFMQFNTLQKAKVWVNPVHVAAIEDRPDLDADSAA
jgi:hypothetical protein